MGLDMYLEVEKHVGGWEHESDENRESYKAILEAVGMETSPCPDSPSMNVSLTAAYWRKANHIHNWFVDNVQDGVDECQRSRVMVEQIQELVDTCEKVLKTVIIMEDGQVIVNQDEVAALLPTRGGFFFGSTDYDEGFVYDIKSTVKQLKPLLTPVYEKCTFYYCASW